jgi:hypothetical protein
MPVRYWYSTGYRRSLWSRTDLGRMTLMTLLTYSASTAEYRLLLSSVEIRARAAAREYRLCACTYVTYDSVRCYSYCTPWPVRCTQLKQELDQPISIYSKLGSSFPDREVPAGPELRSWLVQSAHSTMASNQLLYRVQSVTLHEYYCILTVLD